MYMGVSSLYMNWVYLAGAGDPVQLDWSELFSFNRASMSVTSRHCVENTAPFWAAQRFLLFVVAQTFSVPPCGAYRIPPSL